MFLLQLRMDVIRHEVVLFVDFFTLRWSLIGATSSNGFVVFTVSLDVTSFVTQGAKYCDQRVCVSVCLSACMSQKQHAQTSRNVLYMLRVAVARSSADDNAIAYILCTSGFVDDVMSLYSGAYTDTAHNSDGDWL